MLKNMATALLSHRWGLKQSLILSNQGGQVVLEMILSAKSKITVTTRRNFLEDGMKASMREIIEQRYVE